MSTPRRPAGFFYNLWKSREDTRWHKNLLAGIGLPRHRPGIPRHAKARRRSQIQPGLPLRIHATGRPPLHRRNARRNDPAPRHRSVVAPRVTPRAIGGRDPGEIRYRENPLRHSRKHKTRLCSPRMTQGPPAGGDDNALPANGLGCCRVRSGLLSNTRRACSVTLQKPPFKLLSLRSANTPGR